MSVCMSASPQIVCDSNFFYSFERISMKLHTHDQTYFYSGSVLSLQSYGPQTCPKWANNVCGMNYFWRQELFDWILTNLHKLNNNITLSCSLRHTFPSGWFCYGSWDFSEAILNVAMSGLGVVTVLVRHGAHFSLTTPWNSLLVVFVSA